MYLDKMVERSYFHDHSTGEPMYGLPDPEPCPFCGPGHRGGVVAAIGLDHQPTYQVLCETCGCYGPSAYSHWDAANAWNRRAGKVASSPRRLLAVVAATAGLASAMLTYGALTDYIAGRRVVPPTQVIPTGMRAEKIRERLMIEVRGGDPVKPTLPA